MPDLKTRCTTITGRLSYPAIFKPADPLKEGDTPKYQLELIFSKDDDISELREMVSNAIKNKFGGKTPANLKLPFRDGDAERQDEEGNVRDGYENGIFICPRSVDKPGVVMGREREPVENQSDVYGGCWVRCSVTAYYYEKGKVNKGIAFALNHVWKIRDGEPFASRVSAEQDFAESEVDDAEFDDDAEAMGYSRDDDDGETSGGGSGKKHSLI